MTQNRIYGTHDINYSLLMRYICIEKSESEALILLDSGHSKYNHIDDEGNTAFIHACSREMVQVAMKLLEKNDLNYNQINTFGETAFLWTCGGLSREKIALKLLKKAI
jgi:ankyrin repeat protein